MGLDLTHAVLDYTAPDLYSQPQAPPLLKKLLKKGELGVKVVSDPTTSMVLLMFACALGNSLS